MTASFRRRLTPRLSELIAFYGTPFHIYDEVGIVETGERMKSAFSGVGGYTNFYAVKALPDPHILSIMNGLGFGFDCSSIPELVLARQAGAKPSQIMFTSNNTSQEEFRAALESDGKGCILNLDDITLMPKVVKAIGHFPKLICFRYNPGKDRTGNSIIGNPFDAKYGITKDQLIPAYKKARDVYGAERFGLHTMVCSNSLQVSYMIETVRMLLDLASDLYSTLGIKLEFINMGGGFGTPYRPSERELNIEFMGIRIAGLLRAFEAKHRFVPALFSECGRYVTGPHGVLISRVINFKHTYREYIGIDTGMQDLMRHGMYNSYHHVDILDWKGNARRGPLYRVSVAGAICENIDRVATNRLLPRSVQEGDIVRIHNTGAHGSAMGFQYNGRLRCAALLWRQNGQVIMTRRRETIKDLFSTLV